MGIVSTEIRDAVAVISLDDGKVNAISPALLEGLHAGLDLADKEAAAALVIGRPGRLSGGFDLNVLGGGGDAARALVRDGAELLLRLFEFPKPVVMACPGHAIAAGALLLLASDLRIGARGDVKIGLNEVAIGMTLPVFATELARARLSKRHFLRATSHAELYAPEGALDAGYLDELVSAEALRERAHAEAVRLSQLQQPAFRLTKQGANGEVAARIRESLDADLARMPRR
jgi:enoyl-CoA hydratase